MFNKLLIANRGEIACRILRTARRLGLHTVAVYSEADARARHVALADEAHLIGPAPARESYLRIDRILEVAQRCGAEAIHPGYGFLSENADFAEACAAAGIVFVGPPAAAIRAMGSKSTARELMEAAVVPVLPGYHGHDQRLETFQAEAERLGYPILIKAAFGGGGKGMRVVTCPEALAEALAAARREAASAFGNEQLLLEKYLHHPRHVEIQIFADLHGAAVHLYERDCSLQRRHQKVMEEAPAPALAPERRAQMARAALAAARAVGYVGAGTVEFLLAEDGEFYFIEMNTRLQVEHPVTEMVTGLDLVEWQLRVAAGEPLPLTQEQIACNGHAVQARIYAEDPARDFQPSAGRILHLRLPEESPHVRVDSGVAEGDEIGVHYDPLIAKVIAWDRDRAGALRRLRHALAQVRIAGVATNVAFLNALAAHPAYLKPELSTGFIEQHRDDLIPGDRPTPEWIVAAAALAELLRTDREAEAAAARSPDPHSPWHWRDGWRLNQDSCQILRFRDAQARIQVAVRRRHGDYQLELPSRTFCARGALEGEELLADLDGVRARLAVVRSGSELTLIAKGRCYRLSPDDPVAVAPAEEPLVGRLTAAMPGIVTGVLVNPGDRVVKGQPLATLEAMKMEHTLVAPTDGVVQAVRCTPGEQVKEGTELIVVQGETQP
ncbi:acetyl/propionyl/methylcrotonyl-CoA carboxylase subunit alpha [Pelomicrobium sp.]|jgi:3-methylcrotonyl-CoA carboxylase alpha subunit|uniref:acetyl/propionyl/methylcrotonyl-CoA carboxylase subunit alpha n=1 Tax=Pelomicrobium sp. TaxID=2815319 RepID=UPI002FDD843E